MRPVSCIQASSRYSWHSKNSPLLNSSMPWRTRSGNFSVGFSDFPPANSSSAAAAAPTAASATAGRHAGVHYGVRREGRDPWGDGGEVGDHTPGLRRAALWTRRRLVSIAHRTHEVEAILALHALVLIEGHLYPTSRFNGLTPPVLYRLSRPEGARNLAGGVLFGVKVTLSVSKARQNRSGEMIRCPVSSEVGARLSGVMGKGKGEAWAPTTHFISHIVNLSSPEVGQTPTNNTQH